MGSIASANPLDAITDPSLFISDAFVGGKWFKSDKTFDVTAPATGKVFSKVADLTREQIVQAIDHSAEYQDQYFQSTTATQRSNLLRAWHDLVLKNIRDLTIILCHENGKTYAEAEGEIKYAASFIAWFAEEAKRSYGDTIPSSHPNSTVLTFKQPVGVCAIITPWNFPAAMITRKIAPALAAGCTVVIKPPSETPHTALALTQLAIAAGIPPACIQVVPTRDRSAATELATNPRIAKLSFTGSTGVGRMLAESAGRTLKKLSLELGGNAPFVVFGDADVDRAAEQVVGCKFRCAGQTCVCANRLLVQRSVSKAFTAKLVEKVRETLRMGSPFDSATTQGPLINAAAVAKTHELVRDAVAKGAVVELGGKPREGDGYYFEPTVLTGMTSDMAIAKEEIFGPVAAIFEFEDEDEAVRMANDTEFGLAGYFFSRDVSRVMRVAQRLQYGMVGVNTGVISAAESPFGGIKQSGYGREGSKYGMDEYQILKSVTIGGIDK
ncbi:succinate-semialdehyde mitochondrial [Diplodia corticola]|uniref:Succinate-semialdehyde dehydrogenase, mitochondrial n=1 Tax=Diplodia corticola TaxID=236234 RepID=A0A1J9RP09_9PEZI|nr:succinate-semialdehyde mitochondrial [Diplodia corticola]OJD29660.1 succinate-semialdehyde mitochondrial [Diplodia corticola]